MGVEAVGGHRKPQSGSELHLRRLLKLLALLHAHIEKLLRRKSKRAGHQRGRELLDSRVVLLHRAVEETPRGRDLVLQVRKLALQLLEILAGLEIGISFAQRKELPQ